MPAQNKSDLMAITELEYTKLLKVMARVPPELAMIKEDDISIKDVIAHRAHWIDLFLGWQADGLAGREVHTPAKGYKWNQLNAYNAKLREAQADLGWQEACDMLSERHGLLLERIAPLSQEQLYGAPMPGAGSPWTTGRFAEASGASHYRSAATFIRASLRDTAKREAAQK